jgi:hypothetical protein
MPAEDDVMAYFKIYFDEIHPYVPVISRAHLYYQWQHDRRSISPLLLEALFACAGRLSDEPAEGAQWLALANSEPFIYNGPLCLELTISRTRNKLYGRASSEYYSGIASLAESQGISP